MGFIKESVCLYQVVSVFYISLYFGWRAARQIAFKVFLLKGILNNSFINLCDRRVIYGYRCFWLDLCLPLASC